MKCKHIFVRSRYGDGRVNLLADKKCKLCNIPESVFVKEKNKTLKIILSEADELLKELVGSEKCDHSVNICWCGLFETRDKIKQALEGEKG
jgi:hypothetical protein